MRGTTLARLRICTSGEWIRRVLERHGRRLGMGLKLHAPQGDDRHEGKLYGPLPTIRERGQFHDETIQRALLACCGVKPGEMDWILPKGSDRVLLVCCAAIHTARDPRAYCLRAFSAGWEVGDFRGEVFSDWFRRPAKPSAKPCGKPLVKPFVEPSSNARRALVEPSSSPRRIQQPPEPQKPLATAEEREAFRKKIAEMQLMKQAGLTDSDGPWIDNSESRKKR